MKRMARRGEGRLAAICMSLGLVAMLVTSDAAAVEPTETDPAKIMKAVEDKARPAKQSARMQMTIIDGSGSKRVRRVQSWSTEFGDGTKQLILFESPADVRNTGLLTIDYDDGGKVDDQWLYLPSMRKSTRISSSKKSGSFMGSDLSFADMTRQSPDQYEYKMLEQSAKVGGEEVWIIEARPKTAKAKEETGYVKSILWVSKSKLMPIQAKNWVREGKKIKLMKMSNIEKIDGFWIAKKIQARTVQNKEVQSTTVLSFADVKVKDADVNAADFTVGRLEKGL